MTYGDAQCRLQTTTRNLYDLKNTIFAADKRVLHSSKKFLSFKTTTKSTVHFSLTLA